MGAASHQPDETDEESFGAGDAYLLPHAIAGEDAPPEGETGFGAMHWLVRQLGCRWSFAILDTLRSGPMRFAKLKRTLDPISQRMLTLSLRKLERDGLVHREELTGQPVQVSYELTALGVSLLAQLAVLDSWLQSNRHKILNAKARYSGPGTDLFKS